MNRTVLISLSAMLLLSLFSIAGLALVTDIQAIPAYVVAQKGGTCDDFKILSPAGQISAADTIYFSWTAVEDADQYVIEIADDKGNLVDTLYTDNKQTWLYYNLGSIQVKAMVTYKIYAQKKEAVLCSLKPDPPVVWLTTTPLPTATPDKYKIDLPDDDGYTFDFDTLTPSPTPLYNVTTTAPVEHP